ncbi:MAG: sigma-54-dependent Fis family transcriptional regulator [Ignavibacteriaceae bacterium]|nr:sigma-54-dependent Fis family transcriptional regulator [Ignavibacteriaceae bacterium]
MRVLLLEDEKITRISLTNTLRQEGFTVESSGDGIEGVNLFSVDPFDVVITDLRLPGMNGIDVLRQVKQKKPDTTVIIITAYATVETAVEALKLGAYDYLTKPFSPDRVIALLQNIKRMKSIIEENAKLKLQVEALAGSNIIAGSPTMKKFLETIKVVSPYDYTVLIEGESGTGKEMTAREIHRMSNRASNPFIPINCAVIPESLLESELFGHEKGAFTNAVKRHIGYFERANKGTLFIDDIDDFPISLQVKLLRVLQEQEFVRVGGTESISVDVRIVCATKVDLKEKVIAKLFREDLYYRLNIIPLKIPPLRNRKEDIPDLINHFLKKYGEGDNPDFVSKELLNQLMEYNWPGNVRELENIVKRIIAMSATGAGLELLFNEAGYSVKHEENNKVISTDYPPFEEFILDKEKEIIKWALTKAENNISQAAKILKLPRTTLKSKLDRIELS